MTFCYIWNSAWPHSGGHILCVATFWPHSVCVLLQAPRADLDDQRDLAAAQYQSLSSTMLDWQIFFDWRLGEPD